MGTWMTLPVTAPHQGAPGQMTRLEDPPPWLRPACCFALVIVWTENKSATISDHFTCFILTVKQSAALAACVLRVTTKKGCQLFWGKKCTPEKILALPLTPGDLAWGLSDLEMTWLLYCAGTATDGNWWHFHLAVNGPWHMMTVYLLHLRNTRTYLLTYLLTYFCMIHFYAVVWCTTVITDRICGMYCVLG